jgi:hypothetical protein
LDIGVFTQPGPKADIVEPFSIPASAARMPFRNLGRV